jgi:RNA polymerase sigma-70 factor, ECF subfamily
LTTSPESTFQQLRPMLFGIAYRMLGSAADAEDMLQEAFLRYQAVEGVENAGAFLRTVVTRLCLDQLKSARAQRESYIGQWLPEPIPSERLATDPDQAVEQTESVSLAFLLLLESLSPEERAVFLLREVFEYEYAEIAHTLNKSEAACRQHLSRARKHIEAHRTPPANTAPPAQHRHILMQFVQAMSEGDVPALMALMTDSVTAISDGGGKVRAAPHPLLGRALVGKFMAGLRKFVQPDDQFGIQSVNGRDALVIRAADGSATTVLALHVVDGLVQDIYAIVNPDKLRAIPP